MRTVTVSEYDPSWPEAFELEAECLREILGAEIMAIHHIGSTAVPGLAAKPIIDVMVWVRDIERIDAYNKEMRRWGYEPRGENGIAGRRYFPKGGDARTHHIHIYQHDDPQTQRYLAFRDYLRSHPGDARRYGELKAELAARYPTEPRAYQAGKEELGLKIEERALAWWQRQV